MNIGYRARVGIERPVKESVLAVTKYLDVSEYPWSLAYNHIRLNVRVAELWILRSIKLTLKGK